jgi:hypothetical protein
LLPLLQLIWRDFFRLISFKYALHGRGNVAAPATAKMSSAPA